MSSETTVFILIQQTKWSYDIILFGAINLWHGSKLIHKAFKHLLNLKYLLHCFYTHHIHPGWSLEYHHKLHKIGTKPIQRSKWIDLTQWELPTGWSNGIFYHLLIQSIWEYDTENNTDKSNQSETILKIFTKSHSSIIVSDIIYGKDSQSFLFAMLSWTRQIFWSVK